MSYIYGRRYNKFNYGKNINNSNRNNKIVGASFDPYQPKTAHMNNQHSYYSTIKISSSKKIPYNRPAFNYGNLLTTTKYKSAKKNENDPVISNSYNIINNFNSNRNSQNNLTIYNNKLFSIPKDNINNINKLLNYENKKREKEQFYFPNKNKNNYNNDYKQNDNNYFRNTSYQYSSQYNQKKNTKPTTVPNIPLINNNIKTVIKRLESDTKKNDNIIQNKNNDDNNNLYINKKEEKCSDINLSEYYVDKCSLVLNYTYKEDSNSNYRDYMEDKGRAIENLNNDENNLLFCLFDGHGGSEVSTYLQKNFANHMKENFPFTPNDKLLFFTELFRKIDKKLKELNYFEIGSTAVIIYITKEKNHKYLYCANIGDSRAILINSNEWKRLSHDDRTTDNNEYDRIIKEGGIVIDGRVNGQLMLSRAFGDWELKQYGVSCEPHVTKVEINNDDLFVVMASDGVWDVIEDSEVFKMSLLATNSKELCNNIMKNTIEKKSMDNISCFVIQLN